MIEIKEITNRAIWDSFLSHIQGQNFPFFQTWNWGAVQERLGFPLIRLGVFDNDTFVGGVQIIDIKAKRGHYFHLRHGPVLTDFEVYFDPLIAYIKNLAQKRKASFMRISPLIKKNTFPSFDFFQKREFRYAPIHNMDAEICSILDITISEDELLKNMRKSHRYLIRKANAYTMKIIKSKNNNDVQKFTDLYKNFSSYKKFVAHKGIKEEMEILGKDNEALLFFAIYENKIISGVLIDFVGPMAMYHHAASDDAYRNIPANYLLLWEAILEAKKRGKTYFNLFGIAPENVRNHPWSGFTLFKTGFGGERVEFLHAMDLPLSSFYWKTFLIDWITKKRKGY